MGLEDDGFLYLKDANGQDDMTFPWITQNMDMAPPPPKDAHSSSATQSSSLESALSSNSRAPASRVKVPLPSIRQRTAQACDKCRERKTKCSGHRPVCLRCTTRGLACEYSARETRLRLPTRSRIHPGHIRPVTYPETVMQRVNYQPAAAVGSRLANNLGICEPTPVYPSQPTMAFSSDGYFDWDGYQPQGPAYDTQVVDSTFDKVFY